MIINMPVEAMSEACLTCPELDIDIFTKENYELEMPEEGITRVKQSRYENTLRCKHCERCKVILEHQEAKEPLKKITKTASKTKSTTTTTVKKTTKTPAKAPAKKTVKAK